MAEKTSAEKKEQTQAGLGRYEFFKLSREWIEVLRRSDEGKGLTQAELIMKSMDDVLSGAVSPEEVSKKKSKLKPIDPDAEKNEEGEPEKKEKHAKEKK